MAIGLVQKFSPSALNDNSNRQGLIRSEGRAREVVDKPSIVGKLVIDDAAAFRKPSKHSSELSSAVPDSNSLNAAASDPDLCEYAYFISAMKAQELAKKNGTSLTAEDVMEEFARLEQELAEIRSPAVSSLEASLQYQDSMSAELAISPWSADFSYARSMELEFDMRGEFVDSSGQRVSVEAHVEVEVQVQASVHVQNGPPQQMADPLYLDIDGNGSASLTSAEDGILFDINGDGAMERSAFVRGSDVFLAYDRNGNGLIDSGKELFGDQNGAVNGFAELAKFDSDANGLIDSRDAVYSNLSGARLDKSGNLEMLSLAELGVSSISLTSIDSRDEAEGGNLIAQRGYYLSSAGQQMSAADVLLRYTKA